DAHDEQLVVVFQLDGNGLARVEEHLVVLADRLILVIFDRLGDGDHAAGNDGDLVRIGQHDAAAGFSLVVVLTDDDALADRLDDVVFAALGRRGFGHGRIIATMKGSFAGDLDGGVDVAGEGENHIQPATRKDVAGDP